MPRSPKYVILDIDHLNGGSVARGYVVSYLEWI
jgi:hypothetical protein